MAVKIIHNLNIDSFGLKMFYSFSSQACRSQLESAVIQLLGIITF
jgi:hypothetical protein